MLRPEMNRPRALRLFAIIFAVGVIAGGCGDRAKEHGSGDPSRPGVVTPPVLSALSSAERLARADDRLRSDLAPNAEGFARHADGVVSAGWRRPRLGAFHSIGSRADLASARAPWEVALGKSSDADCAAGFECGKAMAGRWDASPNPAGAASTTSPSKSRAASARSTASPTNVRGTAAKKSAPTRPTARTASFVTVRATACSTTWAPMDPAAARPPRRTTAAAVVSLANRIDAAWLGWPCSASASAWRCDAAGLLRREPETGRIR